MRNSVLLLIIFIWFTIRGVKCQSLVEDPSQLSQILNREKIKSAFIKKIIIRTSVKFDNDIIRPGIQDIIYEFDEAGNPKVIFEINRYKSRTDSIITSFYRNSENKIITKVTHDAKFTSVEIMDYINEKMVKVENYLISKASNWHEFIYDDKLMWSDSMVYTETGIDVYNQFKTLYRRHILLKNSSGQIIQEKIYGRNGKLEKRIEYEYKSGQITSIKVEHHNELMFDWQKDFFYGEHGLTEEHYYKNRALEYKRKISYLSNGIPELDLLRNERTGKMIIQKLEYLK